MIRKTQMCLAMPILVGMALLWGATMAKATESEGGRAEKGAGRYVYLELQSISQNSAGETTIKCGPLGKGCVYDTITGKLLPWPDGPEEISVPAN